MNSPEGLHPESGLYHTEYMPPAEDPQLRAVREKQLVGEPLNMSEAIRSGRDSTVGEVGEYRLKPDHVYRAIGKDALEAYMSTGNVIGIGEADEYAPGNNQGVDWYLGGVAPRYGEVIIEAPATPDYFEPADNNGHGLAKDPMVRHMKSSGHANPVPMDMVQVIPQEAPVGVK